MGEARSFKNELRDIRRMNKQVVTKPFNRISIKELLKEEKLENRKSKMLLKPQFGNFPTNRKENVFFFFYLTYFSLVFSN